MDEITRIRQKDREKLRWRILNAAYNAKPTKISDSLALRVCNEVGLGIDIGHLRQGFDYLEGKGMVECERREAEWLCRITYEGVDVCEGNLDCPSGIAKPEY